MTNSIENLIAPDRPTVSVLMPVYNTARYLSRAVDSILRQSFTDFEFIIIDDGSTDASLAILRRHARVDPRIRIISRPNTGYVIALNEGLTLARGAYVARMDSDDVSLPHRFSAQVAFLDRDPNCVAVGGQVVMIDPDGWPICPVRLPTVHDQIDAQLISGHPCPMWHPAVMMRTNMVQSLNGYAVNYETAEDYDLWLRMAEIGRLANIESTVLLYRMHLRSVGASRRQHQNRTVRTIHRAACQRRGLPPPREESEFVSRADDVNSTEVEAWIRMAMAAEHWPTSIKHLLRVAATGVRSMHDARKFTRLAYFVGRTLASRVASNCTSKTSWKPS